MTRARVFLAIGVGALFLPLMPAPASCEDLGVIGPVYPISEPDLLDWIESRLREKERTGELAKLQRQATDHILASIGAPPPIAGLQPTKSARTFYYDPSITVQQTIADDTGNVVIPAGTTTNPLDILTLSKHLLFFDARDRAQVEKARSLIDTYGGRVKPILVGGSYLDLMKAWRLRVYYDQQGRLTRQLGITQVPALVSQEGRRLRIDELTLESPR
jgi:conjugal transfer pilus assembly protein TraW